MTAASFLTVVASFVSLINSAHSVGDIPDQEFGYVDVRSGAHMFYWFYGSSNPSVSRNALPIVLWLQGGPGAGGSGFGNFGEMGPLDSDQLARQYAWTTKVNLLFIDNPVGAGYSYVDDVSLLTSNVSQISADLLAMHVALVSKYSFMQQLPYWIFSESYGGKMTANFGVALYNAIQNGALSMNFQGVTLGDSWISGISYVNTWPQYLYALSLVDNNQLTQLSNTADLCQKSIDNGDWLGATKLWGTMEVQIENYTNNVDFYYALQFDLNSEKATRGKSALDVLRYHHLHKLENYLGGGIDEQKIADLMNGAIRTQLGIIPDAVTWGAQSDDVFTAQNGDFMKPVVADVDALLQYGLVVNVWNGQLDLICCTLGTLEWLQTIEWTYQSQWKVSDKVAVLNAADKTDVAYFKKAYRNLRMYYMMKSGHMVPADNPVAALMGVCDVTGVAY